MIFGPVAVTRERRADGSVLLRSTESLAPYARNQTDPLRRWGAQRPEHPFLRERDGDGWRTLSYGAMLRDVRGTATALVARGLDRSTPVALLSGHSIAHATLALALAYAGIPFAPISPAYSLVDGDRRRLRYVLDALQPRALFADDAGIYGDALREGSPSAVRIVARGATEPGTLVLDDLAATEPDAVVDKRAAAIAGADVVKILFTSGTAGDPKGVINTHRMLCSNQQSLAQLWPLLTNHDVTLVDWLPWHHTFGGNHNFNIALFHGGTYVIDDGAPVPGAPFQRSLEALAQFPPSIYFNVPRGHALLVAALDADESLARRCFSALRLIGNAAAALAPATWHALRRLAETYGRSDLVVTAAWGLTETSPMATAVHYPLRDPADIGLPGPGTQLLFVPAGDKREVRVRGPLVTPGYWRRPDLTAAAFDAEGYYRTGDAVRFADEDDPAAGLRFDGRLGENFKLSSGTWVDSAAIRRAVLAAAPDLVDDVIVAGEGRDAVGVLVVGHAGPDVDTLARLLERVNGTAGGSSQRVARALLLASPLSAVDGEITDKGSINRQRVLQRRAADVERLFATPADPGVACARGSA